MLSLKLFEGRLRGGNASVQRSESIRSLLCNLVFRLLDLVPEILDECINRASVPQQAEPVCPVGRIRQVQSQLHGILACPSPNIVLGIDIEPRTGVQCSDDPVLGGNANGTINSDGSHIGWNDTDVNSVGPFSWVDVSEQEVKSTLYSK